MSDRPNILFLMTDQMQGRVLEPDHPCQTPNLDRLAARGVRFRRAYTPNAVCSPARASLMTGLLPHNHGVTDVIHCVDEDQSNLRTDKPHWAQRLREAGYLTGYFGKWHIERTDDLSRFGWDVDGGNRSQRYQAKQREVNGRAAGKETFLLRKTNDLPPGYRRTPLYGVTTRRPEERRIAVAVELAEEFLREAIGGERPWCCFVSINEPHDPFIAGEESFRRYDVDAIPLAPNVHDNLEGCPGIYRKVAATWADLSDRQKREAAACYYALISEIDAMYGRLLSLLERTGVLEKTIVVFTSDHGELLGAHGLYTKNYSGFEEVYNIPLILAGPGIARGAVSEARVGLHDLCPTLLELAGLPPIENSDSRSFAPAARDPERESGSYRQGYAEYFGTRYRLTQRVIWDGDWKYCHNGFDFDELYNLKDDPYEMRNLAADPAYAAQVRLMLGLMWRRIKETGDHVLLNTHAPILRAAPIGPLMIEEGFAEA